MGYTPAFDSIYTGSLYGQWPTAAVWASLLPLANAKGEIDLAPEAIAGMTGWPLELLRQGIQSLCQPDPRSRSKAEDGRRLVLIDPERDWGWRVVNIGIYRAKAAGLNQVASGKNAEKVRRYKERHRETPEDTSGHQQTPATPHSYSNTDSNIRRERETRAREEADNSQQFARLKAAYPLGTYRGGEWLLAERDIEYHVAEGHSWPELHAGVERYAKQCQAKGNVGTQYVLSPAKFFAREPQPKFLEPYPLPNARAGPSQKPRRDAPTTAELEALEAARAGQ